MQEMLTVIAATETILVSGKELKAIVQLYTTPVHWSMMHARS